MEDMAVTTVTTTTVDTAVPDSATTETEGVGVVLMVEARVVER